MWVLVVCALYIWLALFVARRIGRHRNTVLMKVLTLLMFALIPTWDILPGQLYFHYLCETEAGVKVFKTVEMDRSYFNSDGNPDEKKLAERYAQPDKFDRKFSSL